MEATNQNIDVNNNNASESNIEPMPAVENIFSLKVDHNEVGLTLEK